MIEQSPSEEGDWTPQQMTVMPFETSEIRVQVGFLQTHWKPRPKLNINVNPDHPSPGDSGRTGAGPLADGSGQTKNVLLRARLSDSF
jgi:hypothetical protein